MRASFSLVELRCVLRFQREDRISVQYYNPHDIVRVYVDKDGESAGVYVVTRDGSPNNTYRVDQSLSTVLMNIDRANGRVQ